MKKKILSIVFTAVLFLSVVFAAFFIPNSSPASQTGNVTYERYCDSSGQCWIITYEDGVMTAIEAE